MARNDEKLPAGSLLKSFLWFQESGMRIAITNKGVRAVHKDATIGDMICELRNCPLPVILRPSDTGYRSVGEGYSHEGGFQSGGREEDLGQDLGQDIGIAGDIGIVTLKGIRGNVKGMSEVITTH